MIRYIEGDLLVNTIGAQAIAHGCNARGVMGTGIAAQIKEKFPLAYRDYRQACQLGLLSVGDVHFVTYTTPLIFNLITQLDTGPNAKLRYIGDAVDRMYNRAATYNIKTIAINQIGCGIGGLQWDDVRDVLEQISWDGTLYIYERYIPGK